MSTKASETVRKFVDALLAGELDVMRETLAEDATWLVPGSSALAGLKSGPDEIFQFLGSGVSFYEEGSLTIDVTNMFADGDQVALEWHVKGRSKMGAPYENHYALVIEVSDGRIRAIREYLDTQRMEAVLFSPSA